jgi:hypothetical protein
MSDECDQVFERLYKRGDTGKGLELDDFADLGLSNNTIGNCLERLDSLGWAYARVHRTSRDNSGVDRVVAEITAEGRKEFES